MRFGVKGCFDCCFVHRGAGDRQPFCKHPKVSASGRYVAVATLDGKLLAYHAGPCPLIEDAVEIVADVHLDA